METKILTMTVAMEGITWELFLRDIKTIFAISQRLNDKWTLVEANKDLAGTYLSKIEWIPVAADGISLQNEEIGASDMKFEEDDGLSFGSGNISSSSTDEKNRNQLLKFEFHVLYHISYAVPYLCFNAYKLDGSILSLDEAWKIFSEPYPKQKTTSKVDMMRILTQMGHPILFKPFLTLHPCRIAEILQSLPNSQNKVLTFLSTYGAAVNLKFDINYGSCIEEIKLNEEIS